jgi:hypothetical protein
MLNSLIRYFDLQSHRRATIATPHSGQALLPAPVLPQYVALALGVIVQPFLAHYIEHKVWNVALGSIAGQIVFGFIMAACIFPGIYKNAFDAAKPLFVQLCAIFTAGIGWQSLFKAGAKITGAVE